MFSLLLSFFFRFWPKNISDGIRFEKSSKNNAIHYSAGSVLPSILGRHILECDDFRRKV